MIYIVGPQKEEITDIVKKINVEKEIKYLSYTLYLGKLNNKDVILSCGGIGKVGISVIVTYVLSHFDISRVINVGTCGGLNDAETYDIICGDKLFYLDADVTTFGYEYGQMARCPRYFKCDEEGINILKKYSNTLGDMISGDSFFTKNNVLASKLDEFNKYNLKTVDMETTSVAQVCYIFGVKFNALRIVSDNINSNEQKASYEEVLKYSSSKISEILYITINSL